MTTDPTEVNGHVAFILSVAVPTASAVMAWAGVKFGLKDLVNDVKELKDIVAKKADEKVVEDLKHAIKDKADKAIMDDMSDDISTIQKDLCLKVPMALCGSERKECHQDRISLNCEMSKQISLLVNAITSQDDKRQITNEKSHDMLLKIMDKISAVEVSVNKDISAMQRLIMEREHRFRKPNPEDLIA